jgi:hypothetical protein
MKPLPLICSIWLAAFCPSWASDQQNRFVEFPSQIDTLTFDLDTVQIISPGRFTIMSTKIDNPDVMKFELNTLTSLKSYCTRPDGKYPAPSDLFQLGQPDLPVGQIEVETHAPDKWVFWKYPYRRLELNPAISFHCKTFGGSYNVITNGFRQKQVFDCKRDLSGWLGDESDDPSNAFMMPVKSGTNGWGWYDGVCRAVTHQEPYQPE